MARITIVNPPPTKCKLRASFRYCFGRKENLFAARKNRKACADCLRRLITKKPEGMK